MATKIRLARRGRGKRPFYHIVVADERAPRDGKFIEKIGVYNPLTNPATIELNNERAFNWVMNGAQPSDTVRAILSYKGVLMKKHLQHGVIKGAISQEEADKKFAAWMADKEKSVDTKVQSVTKAKEDAKKKALDAEKKKNEDRETARKAKEAEAIAAEEAANAPAVEEAEATEEVVAEAAPEAVAEEAPVAEEAAAEEAPAAEEEKKTEE